MLINSQTSLPCTGEGTAPASDRPGAAALRFSSTFEFFLCPFPIFGRSLHTTPAKVLCSPPSNSSEESSFAVAGVKTLPLSFCTEPVGLLSAVLTGSTDS